MNFNYNQYGYNPYNPYSQQPATQQFSYVNGIEGAKAYQLSPNQTILLMDSDAPVFYFKTANAMGQSTIKSYRFEEIVDNPNLAKPNEQYALKSDLEALQKQIEEMKNNG